MITLSLRVIFISGGGYVIYVFSLNPAIDYHIEVDDLVLGSTNRSLNEYYQIGGKGINVAVVLNNLATPSTILGFEAGFTGAFIKKELAQYPYLVDRMISVEGISRINVKLKETLETELNAQGPLINSESMGLMDQMIDEISSADVVVLNGSLAKGMPSDWYLQIAKRLHDKDIDYVLDIATPIVKEVCQYHPLLLKPNQAELELIFDTTIDTQDDMIHYGQQLVQLGAQHVLVSMGGEGSLLLTKDKVYQGSNPKGRVINTVGAGDSMIAGFLVEYTQGKPLIDVYTTAIAAGSGTAYSNHLVIKELIDELRHDIKIIEKGDNHDH